MGLVFSRDIQSLEDGKLREALALCIDRESMNNVLLQGGGEPSGTLLPGWMSGYAFLFPTAIDLQRARQARDAVRQVSPWTLGYDASDPLARVIAERIALNARDAGLAMQTTATAAADIRLVRMPLPSLDAWVALSELARSLGLPQPKFDGDPLQQSANPSTAYAAESALLQSQRLVPLLHLRTAVALGANVMGWREDPDGSWRLQDVWLETGKP
jgi:ABC-type transport system substrate-binding protein